METSTRLVKDHVTFQLVEKVCDILKGQFRHDLSRLSTGHRVGVLVKINTVTGNYWLIYEATTVMGPSHVWFSH